LLGLNRDNQLVTLSLLLWGLGEGLFLFLQPWYIGQLGASPTQIGALLSLAGFATVMVYLPGGILSDRFDRKYMMLGGYAVGALATIVMAAARQWQTLVPGLLLYSLSSYCIPAITSYVAHASGEQDLTRTLTTVFAVYSLGLTPSPAIGAWLVELAGMRPTFLVSAACFAAATLVVSRVSAQAKPVDSPSLVGRGQVWNRKFLSLSAVFLAIFFATYLGQPFAPNYLEEVTALRIGVIGFLGSAHALGAFVLGLLLGRWRAGSRWGLITVQVLVFASLILLVQTSAVAVLAVAFFMRGAYNASRSLASAWLADATGRSSLGFGFGVLSTVHGMSSVASPYMAGWLYARDPALPFSIAAIALPATILLTFLTGIVQKSQPEDHTAPHAAV
jgi:MFS family permease